MKFIKDIKRTHYCGKINTSNVDSEVVVMGWVHGRRDHGGLIFIDLRDRSGILQVVFNPQEIPTAKDLRSEFVIAIQGLVRQRPSGMENKAISTGDIEVAVKKFEILSPSKTPPFQVDDKNVNDTLRLKYRYLDLRRSELQSNLIIKNRFLNIVRKVLNDEGFIEIETPILYKSTPEGARDFLVPSRMNPGEFFALPQSPQTLKQLLMIGGIDRYYQIARCFRDEDLRADRQPEFTQIDMEMSFVNEEDIRSVTEKILRMGWKDILNYNISEIPVMTYQEVMRRFGSDKPDLRFGMELSDITEQVENSGFKIFDSVISQNGRIRGITVPGKAELSRSQIDLLTEIVKQHGAKGLVYIKYLDDRKISSNISKFFSDEKLIKITEILGGKPGDLCLIVADVFQISCAALSALRLHFGEKLGLMNENEFKFLWVTEFPLLDYDLEEKRWVAVHHPFTSPVDADLSILLEEKEKDFSKLRARGYDLVCNGNELAGGSIRTHRKDIQKKVFKALGLSDSEVEDKFGFFNEALDYGTPPHGGIAWGLDRVIMLLCKTNAIREVIAFPKTTRAQCLMSEAPNPAMREQLIELGIRLSHSSEKKSKEKES